MRFRKKPVVIEAELFFPDRRPWPDGVVEIPAAVRETIESRSTTSTTFMAWVGTLEGGHLVIPGDWIITGVQGEKYPCKPDIFEATYEPVEEPTQREPCTGVAASWCHNCGECTCPRNADGDWISDPEAIATAYERRGECPLHGASSRHAVTFPGATDPPLPPVERWHGDSEEIWAWLASEGLDTTPVSQRYALDLLRLIRRAKLDALLEARRQCIGKRDYVGIHDYTALGAAVCVNVIEALIKDQLMSDLEKRLERKEPLWSEDDATVSDPDHERLEAAFHRLFGRPFSRSEAIGGLDVGDAVFYLLPNDIVVCSSYPGNDAIYRLLPPESA